jgi:hypothetical protein
MYLKIDGATLGQSELVAAVAGKAYRVLGYVLSGASACTAKFQSASTDLTGPMALGTSPVVAPETSEGWFETAAGEALNLNTNASVQVSGHLTYRLIG